MWLSPYVKRVELALKVKGITFEYVEEDLSNKSPLILKYNPVHKQVPVLVHDGKPINESSVILEYIDETWTNGPSLLPEDPYERSKVRFWAAYIQHVMEFMLKIFTAEDQEKACEEFFQKLRVLEDGMKNMFPGGSPMIEDGKIGLLDIMIVVAFGMCKAQEQVFGIKFLDQEKAPMIHSWVNSLLELAVLKETVPPHDKKCPVKSDEPTDDEIKAYDKWVKADEMTRCYILASMANVLQHQHQSMTTVYDMLESLKEMFGDQNCATKQTTMKAPLITKMVKGTSDLPEEWDRTLMKNGNLFYVQDPPEEWDRSLLKNGTGPS
ncbi:hypothetical protein T459_10470 [Capsicum annuum]|uniref:glutathione transferase n=1 Tax=Capsicum annuum TaxID=4072 RepID=A0A2G3A2A5_CAPAN|nr:hypothetical protein T459_10470 [Capsicum annuum]